MVGMLFWLVDNGSTFVVPILLSHVACAGVRQVAGFKKLSPTARAPPRGRSTPGTHKPKWPKLERWGHSFCA